jgi:hypothetical protein
MLSQDCSLFSSGTPMPRVRVLRIKCRLVEDCEKWLSKSIICLDENGSSSRQVPIHWKASADEYSD